MGFLLPRSLTGRLALLALVGFCFLALSHGPLRNPDEGRYAATSYAMAFGLGDQASNWLIPSLNTLPRLNKPPLIYWMAGGAFSIFGPSEWAARLPSALASLLVLLVVYAWGARVWNSRVGLAAALVWATSLFPAIMARNCNTDMLLCAGVALGAFGLFWSVESRRALLFGAFAGIGLGIAVLAKGPVGMALPLGVLLIYLLISREWKRVSIPALIVALVVALATGAPWFLLVERERPGFIHTFLFAENLGRFAGGQEFHEARPFWFYGPIVLAGLLLWAPFLIALTASWRENDALATRTKTFGLVWAALIVGFFSLSSTKLESYILPAFPALALLLGSVAARFDGVPPRARRWTLNGLLGLQIVLALVLLVLFAPGGVLDGDLFPRAVIFPLAGALILILVGGAVFLRRHPVRLLPIQGIVAGATILLLIQGVGAWTRYDDSSIIYKVAAPFLKADDALGSRIFAPTSVFYSARPVTFIEFENTSGLRPDEVEQSPLFVLESEDAAINDRNAETWFQSQRRRAFLLVKKDQNPPSGAVLWGRNNDYLLFSNRPKPADFTLDLVAPREREKSARRERFQ